MLFLTWLVVGTLYAISITLPPVWKAYSGGGRSMRVPFPFLVFILGMSVSITIAVGVLLAYHVYLILTAQVQKLTTNGKSRLDDLV